MDAFQWGEMAATLRLRPASVGDNSGETGGVSGERRSANPGDGSQCRQWEWWPGMCRANALQATLMLV